MRTNRPTARFILVSTVALAVLVLAFPCGFARAVETGKSKIPEQFVSIDFNNVDINVFIKFMSELTGTNFVVDQRVRGKVTIISPSKISLKEAYKVFESVLEVHGYTTVQSGEVVKIIPSPDARSKSIETKLREESTTPRDRVVTQLIPLKYADPVEIKRLFTPMVSKSSVILAYSPTNTLIVTDVYSNIKRLIRILKEIDITGIGQEISVIPLEYSDAGKLVNLLSTIFKPTRKKSKGVEPKAITMVSDERTNTIVLL
ncbi:MAG: secretin N-terminal domain-containing protein, partial [Desulfobacterales bacterium]